MLQHKFLRIENLAVTRVVMNFYLEHNYSGEANVRMLPMPLENFEADSCVRGTYSAVLVATVGKQLQCAQERIESQKNPFAVAVIERERYSQEDFTKR